MRCKIRQIFSFQSLVLKKITIFVLRLDEETGSAGEQPASNKAAPTTESSERREPSVNGGSHRILEGGSAKKTRSSEFSIQNT